MKNFKFNFALVVVTLLFTCNSVIAQVEKTLVKTFDLEGAETVELAFPYKSLEKETWDEKTIRIEIEISIPTYESTVKSLISAGRYSFQTKIEGLSFIAELPNFAKEITIRGVKLEDVITKVTIQYPKGVDIVESSTSSAAKTSLPTAFEKLSSNAIASADGMAKVRCARIYFKAKTSIVACEDGGRNISFLGNDVEAEINVLHNVNGIYAISYDGIDYVAVLSDRTKELHLYLTDGEAWQAIVERKKQLDLAKIDMPD